MLGMEHKTRSGERGFQILCSRGLKFDGLNYVGYPYIPPVLEGRLRPQNVSFAEDQGHSVVVDTNATLCRADWNKHDEESTHL
jgi:hypothetical protein